MSSESAYESGGAGRPHSDVLAFVTDSECELVFREGLAGHRDAQVWPGGLPAAMAALASGASSRLLFVDLDGIAYPAGAIHELAAVCEVGTVVVAFGSDASARFSREVLLAGVSDYLVKPVSAAAVRGAAFRVGLEEVQSASEGCVAAFSGSGGSGTTTLAAAVALVAAHRGRYVSVLDLSRPFSTLAFLLDVEPAAGMEQLLDPAQHTAPDPDVVHSVRVNRSERIAVYAYRFGPVPAAAPGAEAVLDMVAELERRSHLVVVDGLHDARIRLAVHSAAQRQVLVVEPTAGGAARGARLIEMLSEGPPPVVVCNHTRAFGKGASARALRRAGWRAPPRISVPFEPALPAICDRGWPKDQLPRFVEKAVSGLSDLLLLASGNDALSPAGEDRAARSKPRAKLEPNPGHTERSRRRRPLGAWWPRPRAAGSGPA